MKRALIIDDALFMREVIRDAIEPMVEEILTAGDKDTAIELIRSKKPDLITLDISLDCEDPAQGLELLKETSSHVTDNCHVVVITALDQQWLKDELKSNGAVAFFQKPFDKQALQTTIKELLER
ncbi:hypothetical protein BVY04_03290 [bacterium M21]|nr:hypothetical protein BVY04_03290 [bacterium M21]